MYGKHMQVAAALGLALAAVLGLGSCSVDRPEPEETPRVQAEPTIEDSIKEEQAEMPAWWNDGSVQEVFGDLDVFPAEYGVPACYLPGYVYSDSPVGGHEEWIYKNFPEYWASGVRALSTSLTGGVAWDGNTETVYRKDADGMVVFGEDGWPEVATWPDAGPMALVQYYNGNRYEATPSMPLGFARSDPEESAGLSDVTPVSGAQYVLNISGRGDVGLRTPVAWLPNNNSPFMDGLDTVRAELPPRTTDEYIEWVRSGDYLAEIAQELGIPASQVRDLYPGELSARIRVEEGTSLAESKYATEIDTTYFSLSAARGLMIDGAGKMTATA